MIVVVISREREREREWFLSPVKRQKKLKFNSKKSVAKNPQECSDDDDVTVDV
jgi:hypothetical protein